MRIRLEVIGKSGVKYVTETETGLPLKNCAGLTYGKILEARTKHECFYIDDLDGECAIVIDPNEIEGVVCTRVRDEK